MPFIFNLIDRMALEAIIVATLSNPPTTAFMGFGDRIRKQLALAISQVSTVYFKLVCSNPMPQSPWIW